MSFFIEFLRVNLIFCYHFSLTFTCRQNRAGFKATSFLKLPVRVQGWLFFGVSCMDTIRRKTHIFFPSKIHQKNHPCFSDFFVCVKKTSQGFRAHQRAATGFTHRSWFPVMRLLENRSRRFFLFDLNVGKSTIPWIFRCVMYLEETKDKKNGADVFYCKRYRNVIHRYTMIYRSSKWGSTM